MEQFARRADLSLSNAYLIVRDGKDNVRQTTFDNIAAALGLTSAELSIRIGKGNAEHNPDEVETLALFRQIEPEKRPCAIDLLRWLALPRDVTRLLEQGAASLSEDIHLDVPQDRDPSQRSIGGSPRRQRPIKPRHPVLAGAA
jgi:hypothetical protein